MKPISRRDFLKITALSSGCLLGGKLIYNNLQFLHETIRETRTLMGTIINLTVVTPNREHGERAIDLTFQELERLVAVFNYRQPDSPLARLNQAGFIDQAPIELVEVIEKSIDFGKISGGAFDVTVKPVLDLYQAGRTPDREVIDRIGYPKIKIMGDQISFAQPGMAVTLDGIAKGRVVDGGVTILQKLGFQDILVEAGGDLMADGRRADSTPWNIAIENPRNRDKSSYLATFSVTGKGVATSGDYINYYSNDFSRNHIIDPHTGAS